MNDAGSQACSPRAGKGSRFSFKNIIRSASNLASTVRFASSSVASTISSTEDDRQCEQLQWAGFDKIELGQARFRRVLLLTYPNGFQVWDVEDADEVWEIVSKRDGPVAFLRVQPRPFPESSDGIAKAARPLLLVVTSDALPCRSNGAPGALANGYGTVVGSPPSTEENHFIPTLVKFYSLRSHTYVHTLRFRTAIYSVRCSPRVVVVALATQLYCFDAATLQSTFSVLTYPSPQSGLSSLNSGYGAVAVGPRWLAYAANQPLVSNTGRVSPQHLSPSPGVSPSTSPANGSLVTRYAKESSKQIAAGIVILGDLGYKAMKYYSDGVGSPVQGSPFLKTTSTGHPEHAGTVIIRDFVTKGMISQFRAHTSPLSALCFDPTGTILVTASIHGHTINVFRIIPNVNGTNATSYDASASHVHLYKLSRGMTNAVIQDIAFSEDSQWIAVSSSRGTNHLYAISPYGGVAKPSIHRPHHIFGMNTPWWSNMGPVKYAHPTSSSPPPAPVNSSVIARIKNGNTGWCGTVMDVAAVATSAGKTASYGAAVAVSFHDGRGHKLDGDGGQNNFKEQLWILSPSGHLTRYGLRVVSVSEGYEDIITSVGSSATCAEDLDVKVMVEPLQKWDVCRRPNWVEREERVDSSKTPDIPSSSCTSVGAGLSNGTVLAKDDLSSEGMHQLFLSNAEVHMHHFRPPLWAKSQVSFHVFMGHGMPVRENYGGEVEIEKVSTRVVEVRKKDLVPVIDRFREYQFGEDQRIDDLTCLKVALPQHNLYSGIQNGVNGMDIGGLQIQRSSSGSSYGSEGSVCNSSSAVHKEPPLEQKTHPTSNSLHQSQMNQLLAPKNTIHGAYMSSTMSRDGGNSEANFHRDLDNVEKNKRVMSAQGRQTVDISNHYLSETVGGPSDMYKTSALDKCVIATPNGLLSHVDRFNLHEYDPPTEEVESNDGNSKSEDYVEHAEDGWEGTIAEQGEDGWEGTMFPFPEDC